jgi:hypothetical protein
MKPCPHKECKIRIGCFHSEPHDYNKYTCEAACGSHLHVCQEEEVTTPKNKLTLIRLLGE